MGRFKKGDIVRCINGLYELLSYGKTYEVLDTEEGADDKQLIKIVDNQGFNSNFLSQRFVLDIMSNRNKVIDDILK